MSRTLSALDKLFLQLEGPGTPMHVGAVLTFSGDREGADARYRRLFETPVSADPFHWKLRPARFPGQQPRWEPQDAVALERHVRRHTVPAPGGDAQLMALVSKIHSSPIDRGRPMWECHFIDGLGGDRFAVYYKVHHSLIDGVSGIKRMQDGLSAEPTGETAPLWATERPARPPREPRTRPPLWSRAVRAVRGNSRAMAEIAAAVRDATRAGRQSFDCASVPYVAPPTSLNEILVGGVRSVAWKRLPLADVRAIGKAAGATVNEVAMAICATVFRNLLLRRGDLPDRPLVSMVPVSLRGTAAGDDDGNRVSSLLCNLATHLSDPVDRLQSIIASSQDSKRLLRQLSPEAASAYALVVGFPAIAATLLGQYHRFRLPFNVVVSNVPGPRTPLYDSGARLDAIYPASMLWERQALNITLISYLDSLDVGLVACKNAVPELPSLAGELGDAFEQLHRAVLG